MKIIFPPGLPANKAEFFQRIRGVMQTGWFTIPAGKYGGTGGVGKFFENLLGKKSDKESFADTTGWEVKTYTDKTSLITMFHKEAKPEFIMRHMVRTYGKRDAKGRYSFRHTIMRQSALFRVFDDSNQIFVRPLKKNGGIPHWSHDDLLNAAAKLAKVVLVKAERNLGKVRFVQADCYQDFHLSFFIAELVAGTVAIDFDARENKPGSVGLRNHGTKFRLPPKYVCRFYAKKEPFR
jgi:hypothetical protein